ncbi:hypothetical protein N7535_001835 [Penicillium sp. DV-2018c]|nr:hypothetical protein N7535_001835 [Penicillium sp. DV-2018c]
MDTFKRKGKKEQTDHVSMDRFSYFSSKTGKTTTSSTWDALFPNESPDQVFQEQLKSSPGPDEPIWWIDIRDATKKDVDTVSQALSIHRLTAEDIAIREPREKVEFYKNYFLLSFQTLVTNTTTDQRPGMPTSAALYILVFQYGVVTFSPSGCEHVTRTRERICKMHDPSILTSDWVCYALIDDIIDSFEPLTREAEQECQAIEDQVFIARLDDAQALLPQVDHIRRKLTHTIRCLHGKVNVLNGFMKRCQASGKDAMLPDGELLLYLSDVQDHLVTTLSTLELIDAIVCRSRANFLAQLSATNLRRSFTISSGLSKVTVLATIFVPCHLVTLLWGMNVAVPGQDSHELNWLFGILGCFGAFVLICFVAAAKLKLL